jgi:hypothetical protein
MSPVERNNPDNPSGRTRRPAAGARSGGFRTLFRQHFYEVLCLALFVVSIVFLWQSVTYLVRRDYVASLILTGVGVTVAHLAGRMARLALADRS